MGYLGILLDAGRLRATLSESRQASLLQAVCRLRQGATVTALTIMQTLGLMAAADLVVPLGLLHMRRLQRWFAGLRLDPKRHKQRLVTIPPPQWRATSDTGGPQSICGGELCWGG